MIIHNAPLAVHLHNIFLNCARYLLSNGNATADNLKATLTSAIEQCQIAHITDTQGDRYILRFSMDDLLHGFHEASFLMKAENDALKKSMPKADGCEE